MKVICYLFVYLKVCSSFQSPDKLFELIIKANSPKQVVLVITHFNTPKNENMMQYIPTINPINPNRFKRISSVFGERFHPISGAKKQHLGIDISADKGLAVHASASGTVTKIHFSSKGYGNYITIEHRYGFVTRYAHLSEILVKQNQKVVKGEIIGSVGNSGASTGNHLHYEIIKDKKHMDPYPLITIK